MLQHDFSAHQFTPPCDSNLGSSFHLEAESVSAREKMFLSSNAMKFRSEAGMKHRRDLEK